MKYYIKQMLKEKEWHDYRVSQNAKIFRRYNYGFIVVTGIGIILQSLVCLIGELSGNMDYKGWITFICASTLVFAVIYIRRFGIIRSITSFMSVNVIIMVITYKLHWNEVSELGFVAELAGSFLGLIAAYFLGLKHYIEDTDW